MSFLSAVANQLATATILGKPSSQASIIFSGPPHMKQLSSTGTRKLFPLGLMGSIVTPESRANIAQPVIGMGEDVSYGYTKGRRVGTMMGLVLFMEDNLQVSSEENKSEIWSHFLKSLFAPVRSSNPKLVEMFYKKNNTGADDSFFEPIAFDDSDRWRNFNSPFYSTPIGLYKIERSEGGKVLEASYYENVKLEGNLNSAIIAGQGGPQFEQISFIYSKMIPMDPSLGKVFEYVDGSKGDATEIGNFTTQLKNYLGIS